MKAYVVPTGSRSIESLRAVERPDPRPGPGQALIRVHAAALNFRDKAVATGDYFGGAVPRDTIPLSDGAGEVVAVGPGVIRVREGDRVMGTFFQTPPDQPRLSPPAPLGSPLDGMLAEQVVLYEEGLVRIPGSLSYEEAATLPCAAVTAWHALMVAGRPVIPGNTVLILGTGGVSCFALQFARAAGARVLITSSSDAKLEKARELGAAAGINYSQNPDWHRKVLELTDGRGVDCVVEVGGSGTLARSYEALASGGKIGLIGVLTGPGGDTDPHRIMLKGGQLHGVFVGDRNMFEDMNRAIVACGIRPIIDRVFPFEEAGAAYRHHASELFMGKVVIRCC